MTQKKAAALVEPIEEQEEYATVVQITELDAKIDQLASMVSQVVQSLQQDKSAAVTTGPLQQHRRTDFIEHGSEQHAELLGIKPDPESDLGWQLVDRTAFGPEAERHYLEAVLEQKIRELTQPIIRVQSDDPSKPGYAPPMWLPIENHQQSQL